MMINCIFKHVTYLTNLFSGSVIIFIYKIAFGNKNIFTILPNEFTGSSNDGDDEEESAKDEYVPKMNMCISIC